MGFTPSAGEEIQSEYLVPLEHAAAAVEAVRAIGDAIRPALQIAELRTVTADELWMSPQHGRDTLGIHFTWKRDPELVTRLAGALEVALAPFAPRPHWGKLFLAGAATIADRYERLADFTALAERLDPRGAFRNDWLERHVLGG
jgi:xylitol oxidase